MRSAYRRKEAFERDAGYAMKVVVVSDSDVEDVVRYLDAAHPTCAREVIKALPGRTWGDPQDPGYWPKYTEEDYRAVRQVLLAEKPALVAFGNYGNSGLYIAKHVLHKTNPRSPSMLQKGLVLFRTEDALRKNHHMYVRSCIPRFMVRGTTAVVTRPIPDRPFFALKNRK